VTDFPRADVVALAHEVLAVSQDPSGADHLRLLARALSAAVLTEPRNQATLVFDREAADQATSAIVAFCAGARRFTARRGLTARVVPVDGPPLTGELLDLDTSQDGQHRLVIAPVTDAPAPSAAAAVRIFDVYDDLRHVQILPPATVAPVHAPLPGAA
jgi:hypothetical protein